MSVVDHPSGTPPNKQPSSISYSSLFCLLTGVLLLLAFCFLPWLTTIVGCDGSCDGAALLQPANPTGLTLATGGVTTHEVAVRYIPFFASYGSNMVSLHTPPLPESQLSLPLLWIFPIVSLLILLIPFTPLLRRGSRRPQGNFRDHILRVALPIAVLVELFYIASLSSAFSATSDALAHATIAAPDGEEVPPLTLFTLPGLGFWFALLITLLGGMYILWARREERRANLAPMYSLRHVDSVTKVGYRSYLTTYRLHPLNNITRPQRGTGKTPLICPFCRSSFTLHVRSKRTLWLYRSLLAAGMIAFLLLLIFLLEQPSVVLQDSGGPILGFLCTIPIIFYLAFLVGLQDGIDLGFFSPGHRIRRSKRSIKRV